jgi:hypothetical protein
LQPDEVVHLTNLVLSDLKVPEGKALELSQRFLFKIERKVIFDVLYHQNKLFSSVREIGLGLETEGLNDKSVVDAGC